MVTKRLLELSISKILSEIDLDSLSASKFAPLARTFGDLLSIDPVRIGIKSLGDAKNYGNRISEATGGPIELLVLVAGGAVDRKAVLRALEGRSVRLVPTVLIVRGESGWIVDSQFLWVGQHPPVPTTHIVEMFRDTRNELDPEALVRMDQRLSGLRGASSDAELKARIYELSASFPGMLFKQVNESKNLYNRIREASGRRPTHLALWVPETLTVAARDALRDAVGEAEPSARFVIWRSGDRTFVEPVVTAQGPDSRDPSRHPQERESAISSRTQEAVAVMSETVDYRELERVKQLRRFLPLDANAENLFEEHLVGDQRLQYETKTLGYLRKLVARPGRSVIVLTGNAGHGKTHMCRRLLEQGADSDDVMAALHGDIKGDKCWSVGDASLPLRVVKDLSEVEPPERAAEILAGLMGQHEAHVVVCANEGRLRDVVSRSPEMLLPILNALDRGLDFGETNPETDDSVHVINLNFQAAVAGDGGFLKHVLTHFLDNQGAWKVCGKCRAKAECPILKNRMELTLSPSAERDNRHAREALTDLVRIAEETGYVLTYRETLVFVAYLITGGLTCKEVARLHSDGRRRDQLMQYGLLDLLFDASLSEDQSETLRVLQRIKRLDPGRIALRPVDERLHRELEAEGRLGAGVFGEGSVQLKSKRDIDREVDDYRTLVRRARRRAWFESSDVDEEQLGVSRSERLGLPNHRVFRALQEGPTEKDLVAILRRLVKGLHTIQGAVNVDSKSSLHLVDPGFGRSGNHSAIIARSLRILDLELWPESRWWRERRAEGVPPLLESVEWIDRRILLVERVEKKVLLSLDLAAFEFVLGAAHGIVMREFNAADRRRVLTRLALHAEQGRRDGSGEIRVLLERGDGTLTVERDGTILLERA